MKAKVKVIFPDLKMKTWELTTENPAAQNGKAVLLDQFDKVHLPADLPQGSLIKTDDAAVKQAAVNSGYQVLEKPQPVK